MPRNLTTNYLQALGKGYLYPVIFVQMQLVSGPVYICTAWQDMILAGQVYKAVGPQLLSISDMEDGSTVQARGISITLSGIDRMMLQYALGQFRVGLPVSVSLGLCGSQGGSLIDSTPVIWSGRTDQVTINVEPPPGKSSITVACETRLMDMNTPVSRRYTQQDQQLDYPGDQGFGWVNAIQSIPIYWNQTPNANGNP